MKYKVKFVLIGGLTLEHNGTRTVEQILSEKSRFGLCPVVREGKREIYLNPHHIMLIEQEELSEILVPSNGNLKIPKIKD